MSNEKSNPQGDTEELTDVHLEEPKKYKVLLLNDDYTPMEFVIHVLQKFFNKNEKEATNIMLSVHHQGSGLAGIYTFEVAEMKVMQTNQYAKLNQHPLKTVMEEA